MKFKLSVNKNLVNKGDPRLKGWHNVEMNAEELAAHIHNGFAFSQGVLKPGASGKKPLIKDILEAQLLPIDIDNSVKIYNHTTKSYEDKCKTIENGYFPFDEAAADSFLQENALMIYTTPSHTDEHHKFRIVFLLPEPVSDPAEYSKIADAFIEKYGADRSCKNIDRMFFGSTDCIIHVFDKQLDNDSFDYVLNAAENEQKALARHQKSGLNGNAITKELVAEMLACIPKRMAYDEWGKIVSAVGNYFDEDTAVKLIEEWSPDDKVGTAYRVKHRSKKPTIASVIWMAKQYGFDTSKIYNTSRYTVNQNGRLIDNKENENEIKEYHLTDLGNSERFIDKFGDMVLFNNDSDKWYIWNKQRWEVDKTNKIFSMAKETVRDIYADAAAIQNDRARNELIKHAIKSEARSQIENMVKLARIDQKISVTNDNFDKELYLFNVKNGIYNLKSNEFIPHHQKYCISKLADVDFVPDADCYLWEDFLLTVFDNDLELIDFVQRAVGLSMCGAQLEEIMFFAYGTGKNGKSVFFKVLQMVFGDYFQKAPTEMLMLKFNDGGIPNDIARLPGARLAIAEELPENRSFDENKIKNLTGGDTISARFLHKEFFDFEPTHTLWVYGNHKPRIKGTDEGIWRRIKMIPYNVTIPENERRPQTELMADFELEKSGILNWMIEGWKKYQKDGLKSPDAVKNATKEYRAEMDKIGDFVQECCELLPTNKIKASDLLTAYFDYCNQTHEQPLPKNKFYKRIEMLNEVSSFNSTKNAKYFRGITLNAEFSTQQSAF